MTAAGVKPDTSVYRAFYFRLSHLLSLNLWHLAEEDGQGGMGDATSGWANCWYPHVSNRGQVSSFRDPGHMLLSATRSLRALSITESGSHSAVAEI